MKYKSDNTMVEKALSNYPARLRIQLLKLRALIVQTAGSLDCLGEFRETLKWGQISFITEKPKTGTTIRIDAIKNQPQQYAMYIHCRTDLIGRFRQMYPGLFDYSGNRAIHFNLEDQLPKKELSHCIALALTYHLDKKA